MGKLRVEIKMEEKEKFSTGDWILLACMFGVLCFVGGGVLAAIFVGGGSSPSCPPCHSQFDDWEYEMMEIERERLRVEEKKLEFEKNRACQRCEEEWRIGTPSCYEVC